MSPMAGWDERDQIRYLPLFLEKTALKWHDTIGGTTDWKVVKCRMIDTFSTPMDRDFPEIKLHNRKYNPSKETVLTYYFDKIRLCRDFDPNMVDSMKVKHVLNSLPSDWNLPSLINVGITFDSLLDKLVSVDEEMRKRPEVVRNSSLTLEQVKGLFNSEFERYKDDINSKIASVSELTANAVMKERGSLPVNRQDFRSNQLSSSECQICNKFGHTADRCYRRFSQDFNNPHLNRSGYAGQSSQSTNSFRGNYPNRSESDERTSIPNNLNSNWRAGNRNSGNGVMGQQGRSAGP